jgi:TRAP-type C4-dicarboxylate transport system substrate-binding protein
MRMRKKVVVCGICVAMMFSLFSGAAVAEEQILKLASWGPAKHFVAQARAKWIEEVNAASVGKIKIVEYPGGQLYGPKEMHKAVAKGLVDIGVILQPRMLAMVPMLQGVYLPFAFDTVEATAKAYTGESLAIIEKAMAKKRIKMIYPNFVDGVQLFSNKTNVNTLEDLKGLRVLATSPMATEILIRLGTAPDTSIPLTEQYMAMKRGVADAVMSSIVNGYFQKYQEVTPYVTKFNLSFPTVLVCMNLKKWERLPKEVQEVMLTAGKKQTAYTIAVSKGWEEKFKAELSKAGATVTEMPAAEREKIKALSRSVWEEWAKKNGKDAERLLSLNLK